LSWVSCSGVGGLIRGRMYRCRNVSDFIALYLYQNTCTFAVT
jgi:hypothetical protein